MNRRTLRVEDGGDACEGSVRRQMCAGNGRIEIEREREREESAGECGRHAHVFLCLSLPFL